MSVFMDLKGTSNGTFQIKKGGPLFSTPSATILEAFIADSTTYVDFYMKNLFMDGNVLTMNEGAAGAGADWKYTFERPVAGMTEQLKFVLPPTKGNNGDHLITDGAGNMSFVAPSVLGGVTVDTTDLVFGDGASVTLFTLPANAQILDVNVIVDTPWDDTPTLEIGIVGTQGKYMGIADNDIENSVAGDSWSAKKNNDPVGATEDLKAFYTAGGAETAGAARIIVSYVIPV